VKTSCKRIFNEAFSDAAAYSMRGPMSTEVTRATAPRVSDGGTPFLLIYSCIGATTAL
jgi:hypothetical protein